MLTRADVEKLLSIREVGPSVLSLYLRVPLDQPALRGLPARVDDLLARAGRGGSDDREVQQAQDEDRHMARRSLEIHARDWLGHTVAIFACGQQQLAETFVLPGTLPERAVFATRPHVRPLLLALDRSPGYYLAIVDQQHAWVLRVSGERIDTMTRLAAEGVPSRGFGGWYGLEAHRVHDRVIELARHHQRDTARVLRQIMSAGRPELLVLGGHDDEIPQFLAMLTGDQRARFAGSFAADPHHLTAARARHLADEVVGHWIEAGEQRLVAQVRQEPGRLTAIGLQPCLDAVNQRAVQLLIVPEDGMIPGFTCQRCAMLSTTGTDCPDWGAAALAVPDLIEEMAVTAIEDGAQVEAVDDPPGGIAARLRFPLAG